MLEKRLTADLSALREGIENGEIEELIHVPTAFQVADGLTKPDPKLRILIQQAMAGLVSIPKLLEGKSKDKRLREQWKRDTVNQEWCCDKVARRQKKN